MSSTEKALQQVVTETQRAKKLTGSRVKKDLLDTAGLPLARALRLAHEYISKRSEYYDSKKVRVSKLVGMNLPELVLDSLIIIIPMSSPTPIQNAVGRIANLLDFEDVWDGIKTAAELVAVMCYSDIFDIIPAADSELGSMMIMSRYSLDQDTLDRISASTYLPPMIVEPLEIMSNRDSGYLTITGSTFLGKGVFHDKPQALDVLNICNQQALSLDEYMVEIAEEPGKEGFNPEQLSQFNQMAKESLDIYEYLLDQDNEFYLTHGYDSRGREYCRGYHVTYQGAEYKRSLINLHKKELIK